MRVFGIVGKCRAKDGAVARVVAALTGRGVRVSTIKRVTDDVDLDHPGSGSWGHREAGAEEVLLASATRIALLRESWTPEDPDVEQLLARLAPVDLVLLEGFRGVPYPKLELAEPGQDRRLQALDDPSVVAVAAVAPVPAPVPCLALSDAEALAALVLDKAEPVRGQA